MRKDKKISHVVLMELHKMKKFYWLILAYVTNKIKQPIIFSYSKN